MKEEPCDYCGGDGWIDQGDGSEKMCKYCRGTGIETKEDEWQWQR